MSCTQGLGAAILTSIRGDNQFTYWFTYFLLAFVVVTLLVSGSVRRGLLVALTPATPCPRPP